jgi:hypothetical protein
MKKTGRPSRDMLRGACSSLPKARSELFLFGGKQTRNWGMGLNLNAVAPKGQIRKSPQSAPFPIKALKSV